jgi:hypothetical protein
MHDHDISNLFSLVDTGAVKLIFGVRRSRTLAFAVTTLALRYRCLCPNEITRCMRYKTPRRRPANVRP